MGDGDIVVTTGVQSLSEGTNEQGSAIMPAKSAATKNRRIAFRLSDTLAAQLEQAITYSGRTQTDLITEAIAEKAGEIIREQRSLELSDRDMDALLDAIDHPPAPKEAMMRSIARWRNHGAPS